jgi:hypothetical protein
MMSATWRGVRDEFRNWLVAPVEDKEGLSGRFGQPLTAVALPTCPAMDASTSRRQRRSCVPTRPSSSTPLGGWMRRFRAWSQGTGRPW